MHLPSSMRGWADTGSWASRWVPFKGVTIFFGYSRHRNKDDQEQPRGLTRDQLREYYLQQAPLPRPSWAT